MRLCTTMDEGRHFMYDAICISYMTDVTCQNMGFLSTPVYIYYPSTRKENPMYIMLIIPFSYRYLCVYVGRK